MNLGFTEMLFIFFLALLIFGPKKLPEIGRQIGEAMIQFRRASNEFKAQLEDEIRNIEAEEQRKKLAPPEPPRVEPPAPASVARDNPPFSSHAEAAAPPTNGSGEHLTVPPQEDEGSNIV